jgi:hypothetical protein
MTRQSIREGHYLVASSVDNELCYTSSHTAAIRFLFHSAIAAEPKLKYKSLQGTRNVVDRVSKAQELIKIKQYRIGRIFPVTFRFKAYKS